MSPANGKKDNWLVRGNTNVNQKRKRMTLADQADAANWEGRFEAIEKEAAAILATEGSHHVRGVYFVLESDAHMARMVEAERRVAKRDASMDRYLVRGRTVRGEMAVTDGTES